MRVSPREESINKISNTFENKFPDIIFSDFDISRILYNNNKFIKDDFLHARKIKANSRPDLLVLLKMIYYIRRIKIIDKEKLEKFLFLGITSQTLYEIKDVMEKIIIDFIFSNPYNVKYIKQDKRVKYPRETRYWKPEFEFFIDLWYATSLNYKEPISIKTFQKIIGYPTFSEPTKIGKCNARYIFKLFKQLPSLFSQISEGDFLKLRQSIKKYIRIRELSSTYKGYSLYWQDEFVKKCQISILLLRDLGIDLFTVT